MVTTQGCFALLGTVLGFLYGVLWGSRYGFLGGLSGALCGALAGSILGFCASEAVERLGDFGAKVRQRNAALGAVVLVVVCLLWVACSFILLRSFVGLLRVTFYSV